MAALLGQDCAVRLPLDSHRATSALCLLRQVWGEEPLDGPVSLAHDIFDESLSPRIVAGTDFWPFKPATDVVVRGSALAPGGNAVHELTVRVRVGAVDKTVAVFGDRAILWRDGRPRIEPPVPFTEVPLVWENAYGGLDWRVPPPEVSDLATALRLRGDHPGMYPRNPVGKGYLVESGEVAKMMMPNLEDPGDPLTEERLIVGSPDRWWRQPLPWCFEFVHPITFPRCFHFGGADAWFPGPEDETMPEVRRGFLPPQYRSRTPEEDRDLPGPGFFQEASHGLVVRELRPGDAVRIEGMHVDKPVVRFTLPAPPAIEFEIDGKREPVAPRLHTILCEPNREQMSLTWAADVALPRVFIPGIHAHIPVSVRVDGGDPVHYQTPETIRARIARGKAEGALDAAKKWL